MSDGVKPCIVCGAELEPKERFGPPHFFSEAGPICYNHLNEWKENRK
jgi:hypothetical protein